MHWTVYEILTMLTGIVMLCGAFVPSLSRGDRRWAAVAGVLFIIIAIDTANRDSGIIFYSPIIFIVPFFGIGYAIYKIYSARAQKTKN